MIARNRPNRTEQRFFDQFFRAAPPEVDVEAIRQEWQALESPYRIDDRRLPSPVWARPGALADRFEAIAGKDNPQAAADDLKAALAEEIANRYYSLLVQLRETTDPAREDANDR